MNGDTVRINISLPEETVRRIKIIAPKRGVSKFLGEAAEEKIKAIDRRKAFNEILEAPPTFTNIKDSSVWIRKLRREDEKRLKRLGV